MRAIEIGLFLGIIALFGCRTSTQSPTAEPRLAKTIPAYYLLQSDSRVKLIRDTLYLGKSYYTGYVVGFHPSGDTAFFRGYFNGVLEGRQATWTEQGVLVAREFYINGKKEGDQYFWWPDGTPQLRFHTMADLYEGEFLEWNRAGLLIKRFHYSRGQESGSQRLWWDNGTVRANYEIRNGRKYGLIGLKLCANPNDSIR